MISTLTEICPPRNWIDILQSRLTHERNLWVKRDFQHCAGQQLVN